MFGGGGKVKTKTETEEKQEEKEIEIIKVDTPPDENENINDDSSDDNNLMTMMNMGFSKDASMSALKKRKGNVEDAVNDILNAPVKKASPGKTSPTTHTSKSTINDFFKPTKNKNKKQKKELPPTPTTTTATTTTTTTPTHQNALSLLKNPTARDIKPNSRRKGLDLPPPEFQFLVVLDYEWTCDSAASMRPHAEIIEWGCVLVDLRSRPAEIVSEFQEYVKPKYNPRLTDFCKELTAITQEQVDQGSSLETTIDNFDSWLRRNGVKVSVIPLSYAVVTWSDADLGSTLPREMIHLNIPRRDHFERWINLKVFYERVYKKSSKGLRRCVEAIGVKFEGRAHSGLVDARNTAGIVCDMVNRQSFRFIKTTRFLEEDGTMVGSKTKKT
ncbi:hypothetical protein TrCOL_g9889 [Triparma columacea]|uniref:UBA domain-containing protein n=1 Tax=Triparma columacea TaxID=722753 RepID=A0A9W7GGI1_9STRA|nr:hypothetical protein TrCOL_g9889 [Triparma columacea]